MLQVGHPGGLGNRLDVITTGYVLTKGHGDIIEVLWPVNSQMPARFDQLFTSLPRGRVVQSDIDPAVLRDYHAAIASLPANYRDSDSYGETLAHVVANVVPEVESPVVKFMEEHFNSVLGPSMNIVGVHIRRSEPLSVLRELYPQGRSTSGIQHHSLDRTTPLCEFSQPLRYYEAAMKSFPRNIRFFISTDSQEAFRWLHARFGDRVFQRPKVDDDRVSAAGVREGLVDMILLSRCRAVIGTGRSSFSHIAALAGRRPVIRVKTFPRIPANWPSFSRWRWVWAYRHFLVESTFWRRWLFFNIRPYLLGVPRIPARCLRIVRKYVSRATPYSASATPHQPGSK